MPNQRIRQKTWLTFKKKVAKEKRLLSWIKQKNLGPSDIFLQISFLPKCPFLNICCVGTRREKQQIKSVQSKERHIFVHYFSANLCALKIYTNLRRKNRKKRCMLCECPFLKYLLRWHAERCTTIKSVHSIERRCLPTSFSDKSPHRWDLNFFWTSVPMFSLLNFLPRSPLGPIENVFRSHTYWGKRAGRQTERVNDTLEK